MATNDDDLVAFQDVTVIKSTPSALLCRIAGRSVWLSRLQVSGKLWSAGDRGRLFVRRWVARDRELIDDRNDGTISPSAPSPLLSRLPVQLHVVRSAGRQS